MTDTKQTKFNPEQLKEACMAALDAWEFDPENDREVWGDKAEEYVENYKLVLQQMVDDPADFMDEEEDGEYLNLENHKRGITNRVPDIWGYLSDRCEGFAAVWTE